MTAAPEKSPAKRSKAIRWAGPGLLVAFLLAAAMVLFPPPTANDLHLALDKLSSVKLQDRWSHPELVKIRALGTNAVPSLRRVLREKNSPANRALFWIKANWPGATNYYSHFPDRDKMTERVWAACQILQTLGPASRAAAPEIMALLQRSELRELNSATMVLWAMGVDADICERLNALLGQRIPDHTRALILRILGAYKPPSARTLQSLNAALGDSSTQVQLQAIEALATLDARAPEILSGLKQLQASSRDDRIVLNASAALYDFEKDSSSTLNSVLTVLQRQLASLSLSPFGDQGGQGASGSEMCFLNAAQLFSRMELNEAGQAQALGILESACQQSGRIFIRMLLLPAMLELGYPREKCLDVCRAGLSRKEDYYRRQAARLLATVGEKHSVDEIDLDALLRDREVGVRVYTAKLHWLKKRQAGAVVPVLIEALDGSKHQSYDYERILADALPVLGSVGPEAREAIPALEKLVLDPNPNLASLASEALLKIRKP